jgi:hypothetical protein
VFLVYELIPCHIKICYFLEGLNIKKSSKLSVVCNIVSQCSKGNKVTSNYQNVSKRPLIFLYFYNTPILFNK